MGASRAVRIGATIAAALGATCVSQAAQATPSNLRVTQEGLAFRLAWDGGSGASAVTVSSTPNFASGSSCVQVIPSGTTALLPCTSIAFGDTIYASAGLGTDTATAAVAGRRFQLPPHAAARPDARGRQPHPDHLRRGSGVG